LISLSDLFSVARWEIKGCSWLEDQQPCPTRKSSSSSKQQQQQCLDVALLLLVPAMTIGREDAADGEPKKANVW